MRDRKIVKLLERFTKAELKELKDFVYSPFFNKDKNINKLYDYIYKHLNDELSPSMSFSATNAFKQLFPSKSYDKNTITRLLSKLHDLVEQFMIHSETKKDIFAMNLRLLDQYMKNGNTSLFKSWFKKLKKQQSKQNYRDEIYYQNNYSLASIYSQYVSIYEDTGSADINLQEINDAFDLYYLYKKMLLFSNMKNRERSVAHTYNYTFIEPIMAFVEAEGQVDEPSIIIWYKALRLLNEINETNYNELKVLLDKYNDVLSIKIQRVFYTYLENTSRQVFSNEQLYKELFELYRIQLDKQIIYTNGYLPLLIFRNIVKVALHLKKWTWLEAFFQENKAKLQPQHKEKEEVYNLCLAMLYFEQEKYEQSLDEINKIINFRNINIYTQLEERRVRLKNYYELGYYGPFEDLVNSFRRLLTAKKGKIPTIHLQANRDFITIIHQIYKSSIETKDQDKGIKIAEEMEAIEILPEKAWLMKKLAVLNYIIK